MTAPPLQLDVDELFARMAAEADERMAAMNTQGGRRTKHRIRTEEDDYNNMDDIKPGKNNFDKVLPMGIPTDMSGSNLYLYDICSRQIWGRITTADRLTVMKESNVISTFYLLTACLQVPIDRRRVTTPQFFLYKLKQEGVFMDMHKTTNITQEEHGNEFLACCTISRRIGETRLLTGNYVFKFCDDDKEDKTNPDYICKKKDQGDEGLTMMKRKAIFMNFFFDINLHNVADPLMVVPL